ncbi:putative TIM-barrel fold metal-dependent hydrolase [Actinomadura pelletieri DSM 43383]|uniref:Putative TIM-barrel fold metal-dependent hydrolase n=1 Tax=Actinomadura pelletieri DSM 43383 TaxID=1120940 RepID=A0A495QXV9_9ACTN|nr:amidohydrolase family protein [Actinomadura pelletieri]RKS78958.1 putative TIM-barrel fold metal-dependent hydrolase [Actinomadura pelletieri DSM 43383]
MFILDTQIHMFLPNTPDRPWPDIGESYNGKPESTPKQILPRMDALGIDAVAIVPAIWAGDDNTPALGWAAEHPGRFGVMGRFNLWDPDRERIERWFDNPYMRGIRMSYPDFRGRDWIDVDTFPWFWEAAERLGIPLMLLIYGPEVRKVAGIAERHPDLKLIVDHMGLIIGDPDTQDLWAYIDDIFPLVKYPNVYMKFSAIPDYTSEPYPYPSLTPTLRRVYDAYGPQRLMWASDTTRVRGATWRENLDHVRYTLDFLSEEDKVWILGRTAVEVLNWPRPEGGFEWERTDPGATETAR